MTNVSVVGAFVIIVGLYFALWGKAEEQGKSDKISTAEGKSGEYNDVENRQNSS